jgi:hypothetical protein
MGALNYSTAPHRSKTTLISNGVFCLLESKILSIGQTLLYSLAYNLMGHPIHGHTWPATGPSWGTGGWDHPDLNLRPPSPLKVDPWPCMIAKHIHVIFNGKGSVSETINNLRYLTLSCDNFKSRMFLQNFFS